MRQERLMAVNDRRDMILSGFRAFLLCPIFADDEGSFTNRNNPRIALFAILRFREGNETDCSHRKNIEVIVRHGIQDFMLIHLIDAHSRTQ